jgi:hypothetical protein
MTELHIYKKKKKKFRSDKKHNQIMGIEFILSIFLTTIKLKKELGQS